MLIRGDSRYLPLRDASVDCVVTSPPYFGLRDYGHAGQIGLELSPADYVETLTGVFREVKRVLKPEGTCWLNLGDSYAGSWGAQGRPQGDGEMAGRSVVSARQIGAHPRFEGLTGTRGKDIGLKSKDLMMVPARVALALQADGWYLRSDIIWSKPNPMPESVTDRPTKAHEYVFLLAKSERYYYDIDAIREPHTHPDADLNTGNWAKSVRDTGAAFALPAARAANRAVAMSRPKDYIGHRFGRNRRTVWTIPTMPYSGAHFATMPEKLVEPCILAGCPLGGLVLDPFVGSGTVVAVAQRLGRRGVGVDLSYQDLAKKRTAQRGLIFKEATA